MSSGTLDPTIGPLVELWGIGSETASVPSKESIEELLSLVNYRNVLLDSETNSVFLILEGMKLDLGAIVKGYVADEIVSILDENHINSAIINLGGNVYVKGKRSDGSPWRIGIQNPFEARGAYLGIAEVVDQTVVTSGIYERFIEKDGVIYHHILNPSDGYCVENDLASVTIISTSSIEADSYSTVLFALGLEEGMRFANDSGINAIFITRDRKVYLSNNTDIMFTLKNKDFQLIK